MNEDDKQQIERQKAPYCPVDNMLESFQTGKPSWQINAIIFFSAANLQQKVVNDTIFQNNYPVYS